GRVLGAAVAPAPSTAGSTAPAASAAATRPEQQACIVSDGPSGLEVTLVADRPVAGGQAELLELVAAIAARLAEN
ncbi:MAG: hypothetical protein ACXVP1_02345, partial [Thermoleophilia bacterium]